MSYFVPKSFQTLSHDDIVLQAFFLAFAFCTSDISRMSLECCDSWIVSRITTTTGPNSLILAYEQGLVFASKAAIGNLVG